MGMVAWEKLTEMEPNTQFDLVVSYLQACGVEIVTYSVGRRMNPRVEIYVQRRQLAEARECLESFFNLKEEPWITLDEDEPQPS